MSSQGSSRRANADTFSILVATDCHLGYEHSKKRGHEDDDSFNTFEEILQHAQDHEVDFILLGGDLFHDTKPSQKALIKCTELLRKYCLGTRENKIEFLSDPEAVFGHCATKTVNFEDPNLNVSIPVFSIHGNHDDPSFAALGSMDLLSATGLVNYFGKWTDLTKITVPPLVMKKGTSFLCLYGLSYINDQRLSRLLRDMKVELLQPKEIQQPFNMFVLHQNRVAHREYAHIPQNKLPNFLDLVIWGHEHECRIEPEFVPEAEYFICQPGSSVATSLSEGESELKHVGLLNIRGNQFKLKKIKLCTVRPFVFDDVILRECVEDRDYTKTTSEAVYDFIDQRIESELIPKAASMLTNHPKQPTKPLIRIRVFYSNENEIFDTVRLGQKYAEEIANPQNMIIFRKVKGSVERLKTKKSKDAHDGDDIGQFFDYDTEDKDWCKTVPGGIKKFFETEENKDKLTVLSINGLNEALNSFVDKGNADAFREIVEHQVQKTIKHLSGCNVETAEEISEEIKNYRNKRLERMQDQQETDEIMAVFSNHSKQTQRASQRAAQSRAIDFEDETEKEENDSDARNITREKSSRGRGRSRGSKSGRGKAKAEANTTASRTKAQDRSTIERYMRTQSSQSNRPQNTGAAFIIDSD